jgi:hypothetical protein
VDLFPFSHLHVPAWPSLPSQLVVCTKRVQEVRDNTPSNVAMNLGISAADADAALTLSSFSSFSSSSSSSAPASSASFMCVSASLPESCATQLCRSLLLAFAVGLTMEREKIDVRLLTKRLQSSGTAPASIKRWLSVRGKNQRRNVDACDALSTVVVKILRL